MSWRPNDLVTDADLAAYESGVLTRFNVADWAGKRAKALDDWLWPQLRAAGFPPERFRTRYAPDAAWSFISGTHASVLSAATSTTADDLNLATILASSSDALVIGSDSPFKGLSIRMLSGVSAVAATLTVEVWCDTWKAIPVTDGTAATSGTPFGRGGAITWRIPEDWVLRPLSDTSLRYYARLRTSAVPTGAMAGQVSVIRTSVLAYPVICRTLAMIFREAPMTQDGPWAEKAAYYEAEAALGLQRALPLVGGEFDADVPTDDTLDTDDTAQTRETAGSGRRWERA